MTQSTTDAHSVARLCSLGISATLEEGLRAVLQSGATTPQSAMSTLADFLQTHTESCVLTAVEEFKKQIVQLERYGFSTDTCSLFFAVPDEYGHFVELFPGGSRIAVRASNYANFRALLSLFVENESQVNTAYIVLARLHLPVRAEENVMSDAYNVILNLIESHLFREGSPWNITVNTAAPLKGRLEKTIWDVYGVSEHVPFRGRLFTVRTDLYPPGRVAVDKVEPFLWAARQCLDQLAATTTAAGTVTMSFVAPLSSALTVFLYGETSAENQMARLSDSIFRIACNPYLTSQCTDTFDIPIGPRRFQLCPDADQLLLRPDNARQFVALFLHKRIAIAEVINEVVSSSSLTDEFSTVSAARLRVCPPELSDQWNTTHLQLRDREAIARAAPGSLRDALNQGTLTDDALQSIGAVFAIGAVEGVYRLIPDGENIPVTLADVDEFLARIEHIRSSIDDGSGRSYTQAGQAEPENQYPPALHGARNGFVAQRTSMIENTRRLGGELNGFAAAAVAQGNRAHSAPPTDAVNWADRLAGIVAPSPPQPAPPQSAQPTRASALYDQASVMPPTNAAAKSSTTSTEWISKSDLPAMEELDMQLKSLAEDQSRITPAEWAQTKCTWVVCVPGTSVVTPLFEGGSRQVVGFGDIGNYVGAARAALHRMRTAVETTGSFPPPTEAAAMNDPIRQSIMATKNAVPESPTEQDRALFSPTHEVNNLFAPIERLN